MPNSKYIDAENFDSRLKKIIDSKKGKNLVKGRFDLESIDFTKRSSFIVNLILSLMEKAAITYKILYWENTTEIKKIFNNNLYRKKYRMSLEYKDGETPGVIFIDQRKLNKMFLKSLLDIHFNYEMAIDPSLNMRVQICINQKEIITVLDIYDDRGFDIYYLYTY